MSTPSVDRRDLHPFRDTCKSCRAVILWATTRDGERMPVDHRPARDGNVLLVLQGGRLLAGVLGRAEATRRRAGGMPLHTSHFATCPDADTHRRKQ